MLTNAYGLTLVRWCYAAGFKVGERIPPEAVTAWNAGEDPSDWLLESLAFQRKYNKAAD